LKGIEKSIIVLKKLKTLDLSNNDISDLPNEIALLPHLVRFAIEGNPL
jgi:Leucine-rich repeat (LRR) protein